jgi:diguanylate cyclase (GGDEF)-like protein
MPIWGKKKARRLTRTPGLLIQGYSFPGRLIARPTLLTDGISASLPASRPSLRFCPTSMKRSQFRIKSFDLINFHKYHNGKIECLIWGYMAMAYKRYFDGAIEKTKRKYLKLNIANKLLLGFLPLVVLTVLMAAYALASLGRLNAINKSIVQGDIPLLLAMDKMISSVYSQELHGDRYMILKSRENMDLYEGERLEFQNQIGIIGSLPGKDKNAIDRLSTLHKEYNATFKNWFKSIDRPASDQSVSKKWIGAKQNELIGFIREISGKTSSALNEKTRTASLIGSMSSRIYLVFCIFSLLIGLGAALAITRNISGAIIRLKNATQEISKGKFDYAPDIHNQDELGELSHSFSEMAKRLKRLEEMYLDTSPLTHLPGGIAIENILKKRIDSGNLFAFCLVDLDNFKAYNDTYGYARGNQVIKNTALIVEEAVKKHGTDESFYGHIGGDDFVVICSIDHYVNICRFIIDKFDKTVEKFYDSQDLRNGFIIRKTRKGVEKKFPIMTISIGVVTNQERKLKHVVQVGEIAAQAKNYAKSQPGSLYFVDRRKGDS